MIKLILNFFYFAFVRHLVKILDIIQDIRDQIPLYLGGILCIHNLTPHRGHLIIQHNNRLCAALKRSRM